MLLLEECRVVAGWCGRIMSNKYFGASPLTKLYVNTITLKSHGASEECTIEAWTYRYVGDVTFTWGERERGEARRQ